MEPAFDVFLSYAREDAARAGLVRDKLEALGLRVFFDAEGIDSGEEFPIVIDRAVKSAKCVLALWSRHALSRRWVRIESRIGLDQSKLVAAMLDNTRPEELPAEFYNVNFEALADFTGDDAHQGWRRVLRAVGRRTGRRDLKQDDAPPPQRPAPASAAQNAAARGMVWIGAGAALVIVAGLVLARQNEPESVVAPDAAPAAIAPTLSPPPAAASQPAIDLSGAWIGEYWGPAAARTRFSVTMQGGAAFTGALEEDNSFAAGAGPRLYARIDGRASEAGYVTFSKTYDGTGGVSHTVYYEGRMDAAQREIVGTWRVESNSGAFRMVRAN